jgi:hypothetical protein
MTDLHSFGAVGEQTEAARSPLASLDQPLAQFRPASPAVGRAPGKPGARKPRPAGEHDRRSAGDGKGSVLSLKRLLEDQLVQRQIRDGFAQTLVLPLQVLHPFRLVELEPAIVPAPAVIALLRDPQMLQITPIVCPSARRTSASRSIPMMLSVVNRFRAIPDLPSRVRNSRSRLINSVSV